MFRKLISTGHDPTATLLRLALGVVMFPHGAQKLLGWFGGFGPSATIGFFQSTWGIPAVLTVLVIIAEFFGALGLIAGFLSRVAAAGIAAVMIGAVLLQHAGNGFFMNWTGAQAGEGFEYHILALALAAAVIVKGGGAFSIDEVLAHRLTGSSAPDAPTLARAA